MSHCIILKDATGKLRGFSETHERAYQRWRRMVAELPAGQTVSFSFRMPRSLGHHRLFFKKLGTLLERTETFNDPDKLRAWLTLGAGYVDLVPGMDGKPNAIPKSLDFDSMDEAQFAELHRSVDDFLWTEHAQAVLWPELGAQQRWDCMESFMGGFRR